MMMLMLLLLLMMMMMMMILFLLLLLFYSIVVRNSSPFPSGVITISQTAPKCALTDSMTVAEDNDNNSTNPENKNNTSEHSHTHTHTHLLLNQLLHANLRAKTNHLQYKTSKKHGPNKTTS
jgi:hypothetical protein